MTRCATRSFGGMCVLDLATNHALTGQRLAPSVDLSGDADCEGSLASYTMNLDGKFVTLVYDKRLKTQE